MNGWALLAVSERKSYLTLCGVMDKKGVFISQGMDRIQSLISGEKRPKRPFSVLTKLNSKKVTIYFL